MGDRNPTALRQLGELGSAAPMESLWWSPQLVVAGVTAAYNSLPWGPSALLGKAQDEEDGPLPPTTVLPIHRKLHPLGGNRSCEEQWRVQRMLRALRLCTQGAWQRSCQKSELLPSHEAPHACSTAQTNLCPPGKGPAGPPGLGLGFHQQPHGFGEAC